MKHFVFVFFIILVVPFASSIATNYYIAADGSNGATGLSPDSPWATLQYARGVIIASGTGAGDTLFVMGGTYSDPQYFIDEGNRIHGTDGNPFVIKAYGDDVAIFETTGSTAWMFTFYPGNDYITIDGFSHLNPSDSLYIRINSHDDTQRLVYIAGATNGSNDAERITIRGVEFDGGHGNWLLQEAIKLVFVSYATIESNYIHNIFHPTGEVERGGDGTDLLQGSGDALMIWSCHHFLVRNNTFRGSNHSTINIGRYFWNPGYPVSRVFRIQNNLVDAQWGGGIYVGSNTEYGLVENNIVTRAGGTTNHRKPGIYIAGNKMSIRNNVVWSPENDGIDQKAQYGAGDVWASDSNLVYNNTIFGSKSMSVEILVKNMSESCIASVDDNVWANNIFYKSHDTTSDVGSYSEFKFWVNDANDAHNWQDPDIPNQLPSTTHFSGNVWINNVISRDGNGEADEDLIAFVRDRDYVENGEWGVYYSLNEVQNEDPSAFQDNIGQDPRLVSEDPASYGYYYYWWHLQGDSPCIDAGVVVDDWIGRRVEEESPGWGWDNLTYKGYRPDIGAYESDGEHQSPLSSVRSVMVSPPNLNIRSR